MDEPRPCSSTLSYPPKITSAPCHVAAAIHHKTATLACVAFRRVAATCPTRRAKPDTRQRDRETHALLPLPPATTGHMQKSRHCENAANIGDFRQKKTPRTFVLRVISRHWRKGGDSNPRWSCPHTTFPRLHHRPLGHPSSRCRIVCRPTHAGARSGTRTRTYSRIADFESAAAAITPPWLCSVFGAGEGNRTLVASLEGWSSAIELRPLRQTNVTKYIIFLV